MACLVHNTHYRSLFHAVVNELRKENRIPVSTLRNMPRQCCTCNKLDNQTRIDIVIDDKDKLIHLKNLINQIDRHKQQNSELIFSLNRLESFIQDNRKSYSNALSTSTVNNFPLDSEQSLTMNTEELISKCKIQLPKSLRNGRFLFLPYKFERKPRSANLLRKAKRLQRGRFIGRNEYIKSLESQYDVIISMVTPETSVQMKTTLSNAEAGIGNVKIHNQNDLAEGEDGEWIFIRRKKSDDQTNTFNFEALMDELKHRWDNFLKINQRQHQGKNDEYPNQNAN